MSLFVSMVKLSPQDPAERVHPAVHGNLERGNAHAADGGGFLQGHFAQLEHFDGMALSARELFHRESQGLRITVDFAHSIRIIGRKGFRQLFDHQFVGGPADVAARPIGHTVARNRHQPGQERPVRILGRPHLMQG